MNVHYIIVSARSVEKLCEEVQSKINEGWVPQGGVSVANASSLVFVQALILKSE